jgi:hypothetical protein
VLYTSTGDQTSRYVDQEAGEELCRYRIDLETYPSFLEQVEASPFGNFCVGGWGYRRRGVVGSHVFFATDFVLGFEMDSAGRTIISCPYEICQWTDFDWGIELRCVLLYKGEKWGTVACHPRRYRAPL